MKYCLILLVGLFFTQYVHAQEEDTVAYETSDDYADEYDSEYEDASYYPIDPGQVSAKKGYDKERVNVKRFDKKQWEKIVDGEDYSEEERVLKKKRPVADSTSEGSTQEKLSRGKQRLKQTQSEEEEEDEERASSGGAISSPILSMIVYGLAIGIIVYILVLIFKNTSFKSKGKISKPSSPDQAAEITDIKELEIDRLLREAITAGDYKRAVRICFLGLLKRLDEDGIILWKRDKTNRDYLTELFLKGQYFDEVKRLTLAYEEVWYGEHNLPVQAYEQIISSFKEVDQKLNASRSQ